ncbi:hypothetical protein B0H13DRAFT_2300503 [Mycena leptocephala]|nr:hypothetical protein B0H13DRAFT_2300503 [Mycena leptocephala]
MPRFPRRDYQTDPELEQLPDGWVFALSYKRDPSVFELKNLGISAFAYCQETVTEARKNGRNLAGEIMECKKWKVVCVDPEHLRDKAWREITASDTFPANIAYGCVDEAHLINEWGAGFRPMFRNIGTFFRGRPVTPLPL